MRRVRVAAMTRPPGKSYAMLEASMQRFELRTDGFGRPRAYDTHDGTFVGPALKVRAEAEALVARLNLRGIAPIIDASSPRPNANPNEAPTTLQLF